MQSFTIAVVVFCCFFFFLGGGGGGEGRLEGNTHKKQYAFHQRFKGGIVGFVSA